MTPSPARSGSARIARVLAAWTTAACLLLGGFAPGVSATLAAAAAADLCIGGASGAPRDGAPAQGRGHGAECAYCLPHGGTDAAPPPSPASLPAISAHVSGAGPVAAGTPSAARRWSPCAARAPPAGQA